MKTISLAVLMLALSSIVSAHQVTLSCTASASANIVGYNVYRSTSHNAYVKLTPTPVPSCAYTDSAVAAGTEYMYTMTAVDSTGSESGFASPPALLTIPIAAPTGVKAVAQ